MEHALIQCKKEPVLTSHTETNPSRLLAARRVLQELKATEVMALLWKEHSYRFLYWSIEAMFTKIVTVERLTQSSL